jgi:MFS transporter, ceroid-lipofuscinosis neuronal protein 7
MVADSSFLHAGLQLRIARNVSKNLFNSTLQMFSNLCGICIYTNNLYSLGTSLTIDQFALTKEQSLKYMGILMSTGALISCATFVTIGPLCKRFDEVKVLLWGGFFMMACSMASCIPWGDAPPQMAEIRNITVGNETIIENAELLGCPPIQEWCRTTMAMTVTQFLLGFALTSIGYPIGVTLIQTIFSKVLGPRPQVHTLQISPILDGKLIFI